MRCILILLTALATVSAVPSWLHARSRQTTVEDIKDTGDVFTNFTPDWPTCANDVRLTDCVSTSTNDVTVRPDCDIVIDYLCTAVVAMASRPPQNANMTSLTFSNKTCTGRILFPSSGKIDNPIDYATCVSKFQSITETCMLLDGSAGKNNYASEGSQAGVTNVFHQFYNASPGSNWQVSSKWGAMPGYMMGPGNYFSPVHALEASNIARDGSINYLGLSSFLRGDWWHGPNNNGSTYNASLTSP